MASLNFYLEKRKSQNGRSRTENLPILLYFSYEGRRFQYYTGERADLKQWDYNRQRLNPLLPRSRQINDLLDYLNDEVWELYLKAKASGIKPGNEYFRNALGKNTIRNAPDFFDVYMKYIDEKCQGWSITTFRKVKTLYNHLRTFSDETGYSISFDRINKVFFKTFTEYFTLRHNHSNTTCHKNLSVLKGFLNWAWQKSYNRNSYYLTYRFPLKYVRKYGSMPLMLDRDELFRFLGCEFAEMKLQQVRDIFCFMCFTGLTLEAVKSLRKKSVTEDRIQLRMEGISLLRSIPLNRFAGDILQRYTGQEWPEQRCFPYFSNVTMNRLLKKAAKLADLGKQIELIIYSGKNVRHLKIPKWQAISTRIARNTFIMTVSEAGINAPMIREFTGLRSTATIRKYEDAFTDMKRSEMRKFDRLMDHSTHEPGK
jgi:integrase